MKSHFFRCRSLRRNKIGWQLKDDVKLNLLVLDARNDKLNERVDLTRLHWCLGWQRGTDRILKKGEERM